MSKLVEEWRPIKEYEGLYEVSDWGNVRSIKRIISFLVKGKYEGKRIFEMKMLKKHKIGDYEAVSLLRNSKSKTFSVHRLVAEAFIPNQDNLPQVNHIDENKANNAAWNLEWCTAQYNMNYGTRNKRSGEKLKNCKVSSKKVLQYTLDGTLIKEWPSVSECGRNGFNVGAVASCCRGERITHKKYKWSYV